MYALSEYNVHRKLKLGMLLLLWQSKHLENDKFLACLSENVKKVSLMCSCLTEEHCMHGLVHCLNYVLMGHYHNFNSKFLDFIFYF